VLILREVLGLSGDEVAEALETTPASVYSALQRAHKTVDARLPDRSQQATLRVLGDTPARALVTTFIDAWERGDVGAVVDLLAADVKLTMPPIPTWFSGRDAVATFLRRQPLAPSVTWRVVPVRANAQLALAHYLWDDVARSFAAHSVCILTVRDREIAELTAFLDQPSFARFGLPDVLLEAPV
jgi:RNA polymerase sigma-70 factor (ECF subfamily)